MKLMAVRERMSCASTVIQCLMSAAGFNSKANFRIADKLRHYANNI
jgi:hypothetical protein